MKKYFLLFSLFFLAVFTYAQTENTAEQFDIPDFYNNPFTSEKGPEWFDNYEEFLDYFKGYKLTEKEIKNKYEDITDKEISVQNDEVFYIYYLRSMDGKLFKKFTEIYDFKNVKCGFTHQMKTSDIMEICGYDYEISNYDNTIDMRYYTENNGDSGEIHFKLDKTTKKLKCISLTMVW